MVVKMEVGILKCNIDPVLRVTGQLADTPTRGLPTRGLDDSRIDQLTYWTSRGCHRRLYLLSFPFWRHLRDRELSRYRFRHSACC